ncbi:MAG: glycosyltransferase family 39 protein [Acidimicrobiales bacterium]
MAAVVQSALASGVREKAVIPTGPAWRRRADRLLRFAVPVAVGLVAIGVVLRFVSTSQLWLDETLSVNIARLPVSQIPGALRHDGAPPLYYLLLHFWMDVFGQGNFAVRAFSGVVSAASLPLVWLAGKRLGGRRLAWASLLLLASSPFAINYAATTRMYSMMIFWSLLGYLVIARALEEPTTCRLVGIGAITAAVLYTHYWGIYLVGVTAVWLLLKSERIPGGWLARWRAASPTVATSEIVTTGELGDRSSSEVLLAVVVGSREGDPTDADAALPHGATVVPPADTVTGAPGTVTAASAPPTDGATSTPATEAAANGGAAFQVAANGGAATDAAAAKAAWSCFLAVAAGALAFLPWVPSFVFQTLHTGTPWSNAAGLADILTVLNQYSGGGPWGAALGLTLFALFLLGVFGTSIDHRQVLIQFKARREAQPIAFVFIGTLLVAVLGGTLAQAAFVGRYTAVVFPLFVILAALGATVFANRRMLAAVLAWAVCAGLIVAIGAQTSSRTQADKVAAAINKFASANDVVVYCPDQLGPAASRLITIDVQQFTFPRADPPQRIDWVNYEQAINDANVQEFADRMLGLAAGHDLWFVENSNYSGTKGKCSQLLNWFSAKRNSQVWVTDNPSITLENESLYRFPE